MTPARGMAKLTGASCLAAFLILPFLSPETTLAADEPIEVSVGFHLDQVTNVDQKAENFSVVGNLLMSWEDEAFAFDPSECDCEEKLFSTSQFEDYTSKNRLI